MSEHDYTAPEGLRVRGTVLVLPGRGESRRTYGRFAARLAADSYRVRVLESPRIDAADLDGSLDRLAAALRDAVTDLGEEVVTPLVLVGADLGAAALAALVARDGTSAQAVVLAGLPGYGGHAAGGWNEELDGRTFCPVHRGVLSGDTEIAPGSLDDAVPAALLDAAYGTVSDVPHLLIVGDADPYADRAALTGTAKALPKARLVVVRGGHHDVLNDLQHRSVAAEVVTFLESLRDEESLVPLVRAEYSAW